MPLITAFESHPRHVGRVELSLDGRRAGSLSQESADRRGLRLGLQLSDADAADVMREAECVAAYDRAVGMLAARAEAAAGATRSQPKGNRAHRRSHH
jgi:hypothetical protein